MKDAPIRSDKICGPRMLLRYPGDPVGINDAGFWFYEECWTYVHGPFKTLGDADKALKAYTQELQ